MKLKVNDKVLVISGKYKGKTGKIMRVFKKTNRITVEKVNIRTKHIKRTAQRAGERIKFEAPFDASNAMLLCPSCNKATRVAYAIPGQGKKYRICKKCKESVEQAVAKVKKKKS
ncbi:MAG: 50S ribosomal protein L24 [Candidatus Peregrinibacteria bacterium]